MTNEVNNNEKMKNLKQLVLDTETTGLYVDAMENPDRLIEIAAIEVVGGVPTGKKFHAYVNPGRSCSPEAFNVHRIPDDFLAKQKPFEAVAQELLDFVEGYEIIIHNARFDMGFLNTQLAEIGFKTISDVAKDIVCTLELDKAIYSDYKSHKLDSILDRFNLKAGLDEREKEGHNALLDCKLLAEAYKCMIEDKGWDVVRFDPAMKDFEAPEPKRFTGFSLPEVVVYQDELDSHNGVLNSIEEKEKAKPVFRRVAEARKPAM